jgi:hypothetical protein
LTTCYNSPQRIAAIHLAKIVTRKIDWVEASNALLEVMERYHKNVKISESLNPFKSYEHD